MPVQSDELDAGHEARHSVYLAAWPTVVWNQSCLEQ